MHNFDVSNSHICSFTLFNPLSHCSSKPHYSRVPPKTDMSLWLSVFLLTWLRLNQVHPQVIVHSLKTTTFYILCSTIGSKSHSEFATESNRHHSSTPFWFKSNLHSIFETTSSSIDFDFESFKIHSWHRFLVLFDSRKLGKGILHKNDTLGEGYVRLILVGRLWGGSRREGKTPRCRPSWLSSARGEERDSTLLGLSHLGMSLSIHSWWTGTLMIGISLVILSRYGFLREIWVKIREWVIRDVSENQISNSECERGWLWKTMCWSGKGPKVPRVGRASVYLVRAMTKWITCL